MIGKYKIVRKAKIEYYEARIEALCIAREAAEERAEIAEAEKDAAVELFETARETCNAEIARAHGLREQVANQKKVIKTQKSEIDRRLGEVMQLTLEVEELRQENAALRKIVGADNAENTSEEA